MNDFGVLIYGLPHFGADQQVLLQQGARDDGPLAILGAGTGLGMARGKQFTGCMRWPARAATVNSPLGPEEEWALASWLSRICSWSGFRRARGERHRTGAHRALDAADSGGQTIHCSRWPGHGDRADGETSPARVSKPQQMVIH